MADWRLPYERRSRSFDGVFGGSLDVSIGDLNGSGARVVLSRGSQSNLNPNFVHVFDPRLKAGGSLISIARRDPDVRAVITDLAACGYFLYHSREGESRFVHRDRIPSPWKPVIDGSINISEDGIYYSFDSKIASNRIRRLVVVFSGVASNPNSASLHRYFEPNYRHLNGLTSADTGVLRIADVGGVVGSFYGATSDKPDNRLSIANLIDSFISMYNLERDNVCLVGSSKGATGAVLHGLALGLPFVAVDPILSDRYYEMSMQDAHFTRGPVFFEPKEKLFSNLLKSNLMDCRPYAAFFTSPNSEQYGLVTDFASQLTGPVGVYSSVDPRIDGHPSVAGSVLGLTVSIVNSIVHEMPLRAGVYEYC